VCWTLNIEDVEESMKLRGLRIELGSGLLGFECVGVTYVHTIRCYDVDYYF
jgi:hypothetical protein